MSQNNWPMVSVVICTYNRLGYLKTCLDSVRKIDYPNFEVVFVNDASTDGTKDFLDSLNDPKYIPVHLSVNSGLCTARNAGIAESKSELIAFTDDDCTVDSQWLKELISTEQESGADFVSGQTIYVSRDHVGYFPERLIRNVDARWPGGGNILFKKIVFKVAGNFDPYFFYYNNEDSEMAIRAVTKGFKFARCPQAVIYHQAMNWSAPALLRSARNASVWPILKKRYPDHYLNFGPPVKLGFIVNPIDYLLIAALPLLIPILLIRYLTNGKRDLKIFFTKWPVWLILRRFYVFKESIKNRVFMI